MSFTEIHFGKMRKVTEITDVEEWAKQYCLNNTEYTEIPSYYDSWIEVLRTTPAITVGDKQYRVFNNEIYEMLEHMEFEDGEYFDNFDIDKTTGIITFSNMFYNGGTCFEEIIEDNLKYLRKDFEI